MTESAINDLVTPWSEGEDEDPETLMGEDAEDENEDPA